MTVGYFSQKELIKSFYLIYISLHFTKYVTYALLVLTPRYNKQQRVLSVFKIIWTFSIQARSDFSSSLLLFFTMTS